MEPQAPQIPESMPIPSQQSSEQMPVPESVPVAPSPESMPSGSESVGQGSAPIQLPQVAPLAPAPVVAQPSDPSAGNQPVVISAPPVADDVDVIEKEWVEKAKSIVEKTKTDPHQQTEEVNALKVDYLKKRYGKEIKANGK
jgi:hypothetical protein